MDISNIEALSSAQLRELQEKCATLLKKREIEDKDKAREQIFAIAQSVGLSLQELLRDAGRQPAKPRKAVEAKYQHPHDASVRWSGRGMQPKWVKDWVADGKPLTDLLIHTA